MTIAEIIPVDETARIAAVRRYEILDTPPDGTFDRIAAAAARLFDVPIGIVSIVDTDRIWFKAHHGLDGVTEIGRDPGLCASAILGDEPWVVTDAAVDPRTLANPLVAGEFGARFYTGVPLRTRDGYNLGTLCVLDFEPRSVTSEETGILSDLATLVVDQLELRLAAAEALRLSQRRVEEIRGLATALQRSLLPPAVPEVPHTQVAALYEPLSDHQVGGDFYDIFPIDEDTWGLVIGDVCGKGPDAAGRTSCARYGLRAAAIHETHPSEALRLVNHALLLDADPHEARFVTALYARLTPRPDGATVTFSSAGHPLPYVVRTDGTVTRAGTPGALLGVLPDATSTDATVELALGDTLVLITDGVLDSGVPRLQQTGLEDILHGCTGLSPAQVASRLLEAASSAQRDDVAVVVVRAGS